MSGSGFEKAASLDELPDGAPVGVTLPGGADVCLVRLNGAVYALQNRCTHAEFPMSEGEMVDDHVIECGLHGAQFDVRTGKVLELPAEEDLPCYDVKVEDGVVWVRAASGD